MDLEIKQKLTSNWFKSLQEMFCKTISDFEKNKISFKSTTWKRNLKKDEGGGEYRILKDGKVFDKVGVNFSEVYGKFPKKFQQNIPGAQKNPKFWASGISVVMHMKNPLIPAMHFNTRYICTTFDWFGGGIDEHEAMLKRIRKKGKVVALESANKNYETKIFGPDRVKVQGVLVSLYRNF